MWLGLGLDSGGAPAQILLHSMVDTWVAGHCRWVSFAWISAHPRCSELTRSPSLVL
jgi:hypothetical protein